MGTQHRAAPHRAYTPPAGDLPMQELARRGVLKTLTGYALTSWVIVEVVSTIGPAFLLPNWCVAAVATALAFGSIPALLFSWHFDLSKGRIVRDNGCPSRRTDQAARQVSVIVVAVILMTTATLWTNYYRNVTVEVAPRDVQTIENAPRFG